LKDIIAKFLWIPEGGLISRDMFNFQNRAYL